MSKIPPKADKRIRDLADSTNKENVTVNKLKIALDHFALMQLERPKVEAKEDILAVSSCLYVLHIFLEGCSDRPSLRSAALPDLVKEVDAMLYWLDAGIRLYIDKDLVYYPTHVADYITSMKNLFDFDPTTLRPLLIANIRFFELLLSIWHPRRAFDEPDYVWMFLELTKTPNDAPCPVVVLFRTVVQDEPTRAALFDHIGVHHPRRGLSLMAQGTMRRVERSLSGRYKSILTYRKLFFVYHLLSIMWSLCEDNAPMRRRFTHTCLAAETFSRVLERHIRTALQVEYDPCNIVPGCGTNVTMIDWIFRQEDARVVRNFTEMIHGRLLHSINLTFEARIPANIKEETAVLAPVVAPFTAYPAVLKELVNTWGDMARTGRPEPYDPIPQSWRDFWTGAAYNIRIWEGVQAEAAQMHVCDNRPCSENKNAVHTGYKHCGGCSLVVYCSSSCQKADWTAYHRAECAKARCERLDLMESELRYHHSSRAFHMSLVEARMNEVMSISTSDHSMSNRRKKYGSEVGPNKTIPILSFLGLSFAWMLDDIRITASCEIYADGDKVQYPGEWTQIAEGGGYIRVPPRRWLDFLADYLEEVADEEAARRVGEVNRNHPLGGMDEAVELLTDRGGVEEGQGLGGSDKVKLVMAHFAVSHGFIVTHLVKLRRIEERWRYVGSVWRYGAR